MGITGQINRSVAPQAGMEHDMISVSPDDGRALRHAFGRFGTGVTVVTTQTAQGPLGMTANSFSSVSLAPPLVLWSAALRSKRHDAFATAEHFCIHVLGADQEDLANHFAAQGDDFSRFHWTVGPSGAPFLSGCLAAFHCRTHAVHPAGDHSVILGELTHAAETKGEASGLLFEKGRFGTFAAQPWDQKPS